MATVTIEQALEHGLSLHQAGRLVEAETVYRKILQSQPAHADALHLLGMLASQTGRTEEAIGLIERAITASAGQAVYHSNLGLVLAGGDRLEPAIAAYQRALLLDPASATAMNNLAAALQTVGKTDEAITWLRRAVEASPDYADARKNLAAVLKQSAATAVALRQNESAIELYQRSLELDPDDPESLHFLGSLLLDAGQVDLAIEMLKKSLYLYPDSAQTQNNLGNALYARGDWDGSLDCYRKALSLNPDFPEVFNNMGNVLKAAGRAGEAIEAYQRAVAMQPGTPDPYSNLGNMLRDAGQTDLAVRSYGAALSVGPLHAQTHNNLANVYCESGDFERAILGYETALSIDPGYADAMNNLGTALEELGRRDEAMVLYRRALELTPDSICSPWNIALLQLLRGEYEAGWVGYEHRWRQAKQSKSLRHFSQPMLGVLGPGDAAGLRGKTVLLHSEQGFGDVIQFCRYAPMLADLGARVVLEVPKELSRLMPSLRGVETVASTGAALPAFDLHCPLMSLPMVFGTTLATVPAVVPYLAADPANVARWAARFANEPDGLRVGLVWAGGGTHQKDRFRSLKLADFAGLGGVPCVRFYSLQLGDPAKQAASPPAGMTLVDWTAELKIFADTAAMMSQLDLVITVDTSAGHLAGALGKPVWTLLAFSPDWRWLLDREDSPWYPQTRLFRQKSPKDWSDPLVRVGDALRRFHRTPFSPA